MIVIIGLGTYVGLKLDEKYPNDHSLFTIALSLISVIITMFYVIKQATNTTIKKTKK
ncbi:MAG: AtpZ/AtpI family protein [Flavobacteriales bacterium]|nr:MAG: AtpZ/AtpI family protein [Flavobacteriales bacterium]